tara:strand:- start:1028 stop:1180 length:153 start_codon:yes stop_codon:yes gene_type:complete
MEFKIECEECEAITYITASDAPEFCPMCGRRAHSEAHRDLDFDLSEEYDE